MTRMPSITIHQRINIFLKFRAIAMRAGPMSDPWRGFEEGGGGKGVLRGCWLEQGGKAGGQDLEGSWGVRGR